MPFWEVQGEAGKAMDATKRSFDIIGASGVRAAFPALATDILAWSVVLEGLAPSGEILPAADQRVILWRNSVKWFSGLARQPAQRGRMIAVEVVGPWDWLSRTPVTSTGYGWDGAGKTRAMIRATSRGIDAWLVALFDLAIAAGAPMAKGTIASALTVPAMTLQSDSYAGAVSELCRMAPDGMLWWDYSGLLPAVNFTRRDGAAERIVDTETLNDGSWEFTPRPEQQQQRIVIASADRAANGKTIFSEQAYPEDGTGIAADKTQVFTISGPEISETAPNDYLESYAPDPLACSTALLQTRAFLDLKIGTPANPTKNDVVALGNSTAITGLKSNNSDAATSTIHTTPPVKFLKEDGSLATIAGKWWSNAIGTDPPDWYPYSKEKVKITGEVYFQFFKYRFNSAGAPIENGVYPAWFIESEWALVDIYYLRNYDSNGQEMWLYKRQWSIDTWLLSNSTAELYAPADYSFTQPTAGMAQAMLGMVSWLPWDGRFSITEEEAGGIRYRGCKVNITNAMSGLDTAGALVSGEEIDIDAGTTTVTLGAPAKFDIAAFTDKFRQPPQNNVIVI